MSSSLTIGEKGNHLNSDEHYTRLSGKLWCEDCDKFIFDKSRHF